MKVKEIHAFINFAFVWESFVYVNFVSRFLCNDAKNIEISQLKNHTGRHCWNWTLDNWEFLDLSSWNLELVLQSFLKKLITEQKFHIILLFYFKKKFLTDHLY